MKSTPEHKLTPTRFGPIDYQEADIMHFPEGLVGFPKLQHFLLISTSDDSAFRWLQSVEIPTMAFLVADPLTFVGDYQPALGSDSHKAVVTTVNIPRGKPEEMSLNLAGPIFLDFEARTGKQVVLDSEAYTARYRVFATASGQQNEVAA